MALVGSGAIAVGILSIVMFVVSFTAGSLPLAMSLSADRMNIVSALGAGLLIGTSLGVVLPEGIEMLYTPTPAATSVSTTAEVNQQTIPPYGLTIASTLVSGYLLMYLLTFLPPLLLTRKSDQTIPLSTVPTSPRTERTVSGTISTIDSPKGLSSTTIGLSVHALADGIALGSSAVSDNLALEGIVFLAIMLHKAPASFSLTAILLRESFSRRSARKQLLLFALSSPLSTLLTYFILSSISFGRQNISFWSGAFLIFSAGTLVFASSNVHSHDSVEETEKGPVKRPMKELWAVVLGICIPPILRSLAHHEH